MRKSMLSWMDEREHRNLWERLKQTMENVDDSGASEVDGSTSSDEKQLIGSSGSVNEVDDEKSVLLNGFMRKLLLQADSLSNNLESRDEEPLMALSQTTISPSLVKQLCEETEAGMMDCEKALAQNCGDFISRTEIFVRYLVSEDVPKDVVKEEREIEMQKEDLLTKPENIRKRLEESALLGQPFTKNDKLKDFG
ncbi:hypothetical protein OPV22_000134 [Ensete ventricosum]|uniref:Uncharacterized protein n=1 Tax=Ensete ventricosum TaxID=4639 RepID=A0AAV8RNR3_ENSVE|nr:hypothetical protein OPV22_000134 [Ensete ventricosum]